MYVCVCERERERERELEREKGGSKRRRKGEVGREFMFFSVVLPNDNWFRKDVCMG